MIPQATIESISKQVKEYLETKHPKPQEIYAALKQLTISTAHKLLVGKKMYNELVTTLGRSFSIKGSYYGEDVSSGGLNLLALLKSLSVQEKKAPLPQHSSSRAWIYVIIFGSLCVVTGIAVAIYIFFF